MNEKRNENRKWWVKIYGMKKNLKTRRSNTEEKKGDSKEKREIARKKER